MASTTTNPYKFATLRATKETYKTSGVVDPGGVSSNLAVSAKHIVVQCGGKGRSVRPSVRSFFFFWE